MTCTLGRTYAPKSLTDLGSYYVAQGGVNDGIVGSQSHVGGYHLGKGRIFAVGPKLWAGSSQRGCVSGRGWADYSVQTAYDKAGLTDAAAAIDLGPIAGSFQALRSLTAYLLDACRTNRTVASDVRELIGSLDGTTMFAWLRERDGANPGQPYTKDPSHLSHTHLSFRRDSESRDKTALLKGYFVQGGTNVEDPMGLSLSIPAVALEGTVSVAVGKTVYKVADASPVVLTVAASPRPAYAVDHPGHEPGYLLDITSGGVTEAYFVRAIDSTFTSGATRLAPGLYEVPA